MKKTAIIMAALISISASAHLFAEEPTQQPQEEKTRTLFSSDVHLSGFGGLMAQGSYIGHSYVCLPGFRAGLIADNCVFGFSGYGLGYPQKRSSLSGKSYSGTEPYMNLGYGGFLFQYHFAPKDLFHIAAGVTVGGGGIYFTDRKSDDDNDNDKHHARGKAFFYIEPEINGYVNVTKWCRIGAGISYRFVQGAKKDEFSDRDLRNAGATCFAEFGWF